MTADDLVFYHAPKTRSFGVLVLLEELRAPYRLHALDRAAGENRSPEFLAVNPLGKVPALTDRGHAVTEQVAIVLHLADLFPEAGLAPSLTDPDRGPYVRWLVYYAASFEPAVVDRAMKREPGPQGMSPYGDFDAMLGALTAQLARGPYLLGDRFTAADVLWGTALAWVTMFKLVPETPEIMAYVARVGGRPSVARARAIDAELAATQEAAKAAREAA